MPARDAYHEPFKRALQKDGWTITHDPYVLSVGGRNVFVDLGAERLVAAERADERIAVEIKTFSGPSDLADLEMALGQYVLYLSLLRRFDQGRHLLLAVPDLVWATTLGEPIARPVVEDLQLRLVTFDPGKECLVRWIP